MLWRCVKQSAVVQAGENYIEKKMKAKTSSTTVTTHRQRTWANIQQGCTGGAGRGVEVAILVVCALFTLRGKFRRPGGFVPWQKTPSHACHATILTSKPAHDLGATQQHFTFHRSSPEEAGNSACRVLIVNHRVVIYRLNCVGAYVSLAALLVDFFLPNAPLSVYDAAVPSTPPSAA